MSEILPAGQFVNDGGGFLNLARAPIDAKMLVADFSSINKLGALAEGQALYQDMIRTVTTGSERGLWMLQVLDETNPSNNVWEKLQFQFSPTAPSASNRLLQGGEYEQDDTDPNKYNLEPSRWTIDFVPYQIDSTSFTIGLTSGDLLRFDRPVLKNDGTIEIIPGVEALKPIAPFYDPTTSISRELILVSNEGTEIIHNDWFYLLASNSREKITGRKVIDNFAELFARPIASAELTKTYFDDNFPISLDLVFDNELELFKIIPQFDSSIFTIIQVDYTDVTKLNILSGRNIFFQNNVEDEDDINAILEFIDHSNNLRGGIHNPNKNNEYPFTEYLPDFDFYETNDPTFYRTDSTMNSWVGGTGIAIAANRSLKQAPKQGSSIAYYIFTDKVNTIWNTYVIEYNIETRNYTTYTQTNFQSSYDNIQSAIWVSNELYLPCGSATPDKILIYNSTSHTFTISTISNPQSNPIYWQFYAHSDGTNVWFVAGRGGLPEADRRCVTKINITTKVYTWVRSIANTYQNFFSTATHMYMIRRPGAVYTNELTRYGYVDNSWNEAFSIISNSALLQMFDGQIIPIVSGKACLFYRDSIDLKMAVIDNLDAVSFGGETSTVSTISLGHYGAYSIYDNTNTYVYRVLDNGSIIRITLSSATVTNYPSLLPIDGQMTTLDDSSYQGFVNPNNGYLYINSNNSTKYLTYIIDTATMTLVETLSTRNLYLIDAQYYGTKVATLFNYNQPTVLDGLKWKADINIVSSGPYFTNGVEAYPKANDTSFYVNFYDNLKERLSGLFVDGSAYVPLAGTTLGNPITGNIEFTPGQQLYAGTISSGIIPYGEIIFFDDSIELFTQIGTTKDYAGQIVRNGSNSSTSQLYAGASATAPSNYHEIQLTLEPGSAKKQITIHTRSADSIDWGFKGIVYDSDYSGNFVDLSLIHKGFGDTNYASFVSNSSDPTTSDIVAGRFRIYKNTTSNLVKLWANDGGTLKSITLT